MPLDSPLMGWWEEQMSRQYSHLCTISWKEIIDNGKAEIYVFCWKRAPVVLNLEVSQVTMISHDTNHEASSFPIWLSLKVAGARSWCLWVGVYQRPFISRMWIFFIFSLLKSLWLQFYSPEKARLLGWRNCMALQWTNFLYVGLNTQSNAQ